MKYAVIRDHVGLFPVTLMCRVLEVSRSGFYRWLSMPVSARALWREELEQHVVDTYQQFKAAYGAPRIAQELCESGIPCSTNTVANIMQIKGIRARNGKGFVYRDASPAMNNVVDNLLWRDFFADAPNRKWVTDMTYIWAKDRWVYLATVMDLYSRAIVGWSIDTTMTEKLVTDALAMAFARRTVQPGLIIHSDRGVQYRAIKYQDFVRRHGAIPSMSRKGNCWDNAVMESFYSRLKVEMIYANQYNNIEAVKKDVFEYIEVFYNRKRRHSALGYISPARFEQVSA